MRAAAPSRPMKAAALGLGFDSMDNVAPATKKVLIVIGALAALALVIVLATAFRSLLRTSVYTPSLTSDKENKIEVSGIFGSNSLEAGTHQWKFEAQLSDGSRVTATRDFAVVSPYGASPTPTATVLPYGGG